ncbi:ATP synthase gamma chain [Buchnera aphidicola (Eriosoma grossulariae)]|uniref:F0F1 ATP synthase subunit gamma n=1 Tax=Buchnera aphidicola TaxID=9 RepID=UPI003464C219
MAVVKEIKNKINSIINTKKITKAMEMVAVSKMKKIQEKLFNCRPYYENLIKVINHITYANLEYKHQYFQKRKVKNIGIIIISTDRGLCSNLNTNLFKKILLYIEKYSKKNITFKLIIFGSKGWKFFNDLNINILGGMTGIHEKINISELLGHIHIFLKEYNQKSIDKISIAYNHFYNTMIQKPKIINLLPINQTIQQDAITRWDYIYEPNSKILLDTLLNRFIESQIYQSILENLTSEQAARMIAMKTATDNSSNVIKELKLIYNKARQSSITQELIEIISGASVISTNE